MAETNVTVSAIHIMPVDDLVEHDDCIACWCQPRTIQEPDAVLVVVHHAMDGRELIEEHGIQ